MLPLCFQKLSPADETNSVCEREMFKFIVANPQVTVDFDKSKAQPGDNVTVTVTADAKSVVNLLAVDQSVLLLKSGNDITPSEVSTISDNTA